MACNGEKLRAKSSLPMGFGTILVNIPSLLCDHKDGGRFGSGRGIEPAL